jgi:opacity protein-like surface antigen
VLGTLAAKAGFTGRENLMTMKWVLGIAVVALLCGLAPAVSAQSVDSPLRSAPVEEGEAAEATPAEDAAPPEQAPADADATPQSEEVPGETQQADVQSDETPAGEAPAEEANLEESTTEETPAEESAEAAAQPETIPDAPPSDGTVAPDPQSADLEPNETDGEAPPAVDPNGRAANHVRLEILGAVSVPATGQDTGAAFGGFIGYDLWDQIGFELLLAQTWSGTEFDDGSTSNLRLLSVKPGLRYRLMTWKENTLRVYVAAHAGYVQSNWQDPVTGFDKYQDAFGFDGGAGMEFRFAKLILLDLFVLYEGGIDAAPVLPSSGFKIFHGLFAGLGVGVSSTLD